MHRIGFLHTSPMHTEWFDRLVADLASDVTAVAVVDEALLDDARTLGVAAPGVLGAIDRALDSLHGAGVDTIVCTCSTIGGEAESRGIRRGLSVLRVDRPMAEQAVMIGGRTGVVAALASTVGPTTSLIAEVAACRASDVEVTVWMCDRAWELFEAGDVDGYLDSVATVCDTAAETSDVVVLAQASMADAVPRCRTTVPVLSSPALAVRAAARAGSIR